MSDLIVLGSNSFSGAAFVKYALSKGTHVLGIVDLMSLSLNFYLINRLTTQTFPFTN